MIMTSNGKTFYERQVTYLEKGDVEALVSNQYNPDAQLIGFDFTVVGHDALRDHFRDYLDHLGGLKLLSTDKFTETEDSIFFEATVRVGGGEAQVYDVFVLENGKISRHFTGLLGFTPIEKKFFGSE